MRVRPGSLPALAAWSGAGVGVQGLARSLYSVLVGRIRGPGVLGTINPGISLAMLASMVAPSAAGSAATKFLARLHGAQEPLLAGAVAAHLARRVLVVSAGLAVVAVGAARWILDVGWVLSLSVGWLTAAYSGYLFVRGVQFGTGRVARATGWEVASASTALVLLAVVLATGSTAWLLAPLAVGYTAYAVAGWPRTGRAAGERDPAGRAVVDRAVVDRALRREMDAFIGWGVVGNLASAGLLQLSVVLAAAADTSERAGLYAAAVALATPASLLSRSLSLVLFPAMASAAGRGDQEGVRRQTDLVTRGLVTVMVGVFGALFLAAPLLLRLFGPEYAAADGLLRVVLVAVCVSTVAVGAVNSLTSGGPDGIRLSATMSACGFAVGIAVMAAGASTWGVDAVAVGYLTGATITAGAPTVLVARRSGLAWWPLLARSAIGAAAVAGLVLVQGDSPWAVAGTALAFLGVWAVLSRAETGRLLAAAR